MIGLPVALATAVGVTYGAAFGAFGADAQPRAAAATTAPAWAGAAADGFASVDALGQHGTYGGRGGAIVTVRTQADLEKYATAAQPYVIVVAGAITMAPKGTEIKVASHKTIVGSGTSGHLVGGGFFLGQGVHNVIIRNLTIRDSYAGTWNDKEHDWDAIQMDGAHHVWIDHNDLRHMADGLIDSRKDTTYLTVSWNRLTNDNKAFGIGWTDHVTADLTIHHNWFHETQQRNPSADNVAHAHLYNNFLQDDPGTSITAAYGNYARGGTRMVLENSYFDGVANPVTRDRTASVVQRGNLFAHTTGRNESGGTAFDPHAYYSYTLDPAAAVPATVKAGAGPRSTIGTASVPASAPSPVPAATTAFTVAKDGSGRYRTVQAAVDAAPSNSASRTVISIAPGTYRETVRIPAGKPRLTLRGAGGSRKDTVIVQNHASGTPKPGGSGTYGTAGSATVTVEADDFEARGLTIANDFDEKADPRVSAQAVALRTAADRVRLDDVSVTGDQDTLELEAAGRKPGRVLVTNSEIVGNVDFVFGGATAVIDRSVLTLKQRADGSSGGCVTAPSTAAGRKGFLITRSTVGGAVAPGGVSLGRPWHAGGDASLDPQTTVSHSTLGRAVSATPWADMGGFSWKDDRFAEYRNTGPGAGPASGSRPQLTGAQAAGQEIGDWLGDWTPAGS